MFLNQIPPLPPPKKSPPLCRIFSLAENIWGSFRRTLPVPRKIRQIVFVPFARATRAPVLYYLAERGSYEYKPQFFVIENYEPVWAVLFLLSKNLHPIFTLTGREGERGSYLPYLNKTRILEKKKGKRVPNIDDGYFIKPKN